MALYLSLIKSSVVPSQMMPIKQSILDKKPGSTENSYNI